jgi:hypothetical protein
MDITSVTLTATKIFIEMPSYLSEWSFWLLINRNSHLDDRLWQRRPSQTRPLEPILWCDMCVSLPGHTTRRAWSKSGNKSEWHWSLRLKAKTTCYKYLYGLDPVVYHQISRTFQYQWWTNLGWSIPWRSLGKGDLFENEITFKWELAVKEIQGVPPGDERLNITCL